MALERTPELAEKPFLFPIAHNQAELLANLNRRISIYLSYCGLSD
jgi:hypothetical protein